MNFCILTNYLVISKLHNVTLVTEVGHKLFSKGESEVINFIRNTENYPESI